MILGSKVDRSLVTRKVVLCPRGSSDLFVVRYSELYYCGDGWE